MADPAAPAPAQAPAPAAPANPNPAPADAPKGTAPAAPPAGAPAPAKTLLGSAETPPAKDAPGKGDDVALDLKLPEGVTVDAAVMDSFKDIAKEGKLQGPQAQKLVDLYVGAQEAQAKAALAAHQEQVAAWAEAAKTDQEIGGANFDGTMQLAAKTMQALATPQLRTLIEESGLGNHPEVIRLFARVGKALSEDSVAGSGGTGAPGPSESDFLKQMYPSMFKNRG